MDNGNNNTKIADLIKSAYETGIDDGIGDCKGYTGYCIEDWIEENIDKLKELGIKITLK